MLISHKVYRILKHAPDSMRLKLHCVSLSATVAYIAIAIANYACSRTNNGDY